MKLFPILCVGLLSSTAFFSSADVTFAATNLNSSRSNIYRLNSNDPNAATACTASGGTLSTDKDGNKICVKPEPASTTIIRSKSNITNN